MYICQENFFYKNNLAKSFCFTKTSSLLQSADLLQHLIILISSSLINKYFFANDELTRLYLVPKVDNIKF